MRRLFAVLLLLVVMLVPAKAGAATKGIGISPAIREVVLEAGKPSVEFTVKLFNTTDQAAELQVTTLDFGSLDESGGIAFLGRSGQEAGDHGLKRWMKQDREDVSLAAGAASEVKVTVMNDDALRPGGHYGAVVVTAKHDGNAGESVAVLPAASSLVLLKKTGGEYMQLELSGKKANSSLLTLPKAAALKFKNTGNTHVVPRGTVQLSDPFGNVIARSVINETSAFVLPGSTRQFSTDIPLTSQPWLPGRYKLDVHWRYDGQEHFAHEVSHKWYIGKLTLILIVVSSLLFVLVSYIRYRRRPVARGR